MKKIIFRFLLFTLLIVFGFIAYLSTIGIKTDAFNSQISKEVKKIDNQLELDLDKISIILDPFKFKLVLRTVGVNLSSVVLEEDCLSCFNTTSLVALCAGVLCSGFHCFVSLRVTW